MKNLITILLFAFTINICNAYQIDSVLTNTSNVITQLDTSSNLKMVTTKTMEAIQYLAVGLKVSVNEVWDILVKQQQIKSWTFLLLLISSLFLDFLLFKLIKYSYKQCNLDNLPIGYLLIILISCVVMGAYSFYNVENLYPMLTGFFNPEYGAMADIVEIAKTLK